MAWIVIIALVLVVASVAAGAPLAEPSRSKTKPSHVGTPDVTILIKVTTTLPGPASSFIPTAVETLAESRNRSNQKSQKRPSRNTASLSIQNSIKLCSNSSIKEVCENSTTQSRQNWMKLSGKNPATFMLPVIKTRLGDVGGEIRVEVRQQFPRKLTSQPSPNATSRSSQNAISQSSQNVTSQSS